jgi:hypothetical protein
MGKLAQSVQQGLQEASQRREPTRERRASQRRVGLTAHPQSRTPSHRLTQGPRLMPGTIVKADDPTMAPMCQGQSHGPTPFGRTPGLLSGPAAGVVLAVPRPVGHPRDARSGVPLVDTVEPALARVTSRPQLAIHAVAGDLGGIAPQVPHALDARGLLTIGMAQTVAPMTPAPTSEAGLAILKEAGWPRTRTPPQVRRACAWGYSRPVGERHLASWLARGAGQLRSKGPHGAGVQLGLTVRAPTGAPLVRIPQPRLSKRAQQCRRLLGLRRCHIKRIDDCKN